MRLGPIVLILVSAGVVAASALAAPVAKDPFSLLLRAADVPGAKGTRGRGPAQLEQGLRGLGVHGKAAWHHYDFKTGAAAGKSVSGLVIAIRSAGQARTAFAVFKRDMLEESRNTVRLPSYGDQQVATVVRDPMGADVLVRKNTVVWQLSIRAVGLHTFTRAQALAELKKYAAKQKLRVGRG